MFIVLELEQEVQSVLEGYLGRFTRFPATMHDERITFMLRGNGRIKGASLYWQSEVK